jgi:tetratricopeptide (TPR) repeat protein
MQNSPTTGQRSFTIFISYSRRNTPIADALVDKLIERGFQVKIDRRSLEFGEEWKAELAEFIRLSDTVIWLISTPSITSTWVNWELDEVLKRSKRLVPIVIDNFDRDQLPRQLGEIHLLPAEGTFALERDIGLLVRVLETDHVWLREGTRLADRAQEWEDAHSNSAALLLRGPALRAAEYWKDARPPKAPTPPQAVLELILASRRSATYRQRWWTIGSLAIAILSLGLAGTAYFEQTRAVAQSDLASKRFVAAKDAADQLITNLAQNLRVQVNLPQDTIEVLLGAANRIMTKLLEDSGGDPELRLSHTNMLTQFGQLLFLKGNMPLAGRYANDCVDSVKSLLQLKLTPEQYRSGILFDYACYYQKADISRNLGFGSQAEDYIRHAIAILEKRMNEQGDRQADILADYGRSRARLGDILRTQENFLEANNEYQAALATDIMLETSGASDNIEQQISWKHNQIGDTLLKISNHESLITTSSNREPIFDVQTIQSALDHYEVALKIRRDLLTHANRDPDRTRDVIWSLALTGMARSQIDLTKGQQLFNEGLSEVSRLLRNDNKNTELMRYKALIHTFLGDTFIRESRDEAAFAEYAEALSIRKNLHEKIAPDNPRFLRDYFYTLVRVDKICRMFGNHEICDGTLSRAKQLLTELTQAYPSDMVLVRTMGEVRATTP